MEYQIEKETLTFLLEKTDFFLWECLCVEVLVQSQKLVCMRNVLKLIAVANSQLLCCLVIQVEFSAEYEERGVVSTLIVSEEVCSFDLAFLKKDSWVW